MTNKENNSKEQQRAKRTITFTNVIMAGKKTLTVGDSIVKNVEGWRLNKRMKS